jgi:hypothetical protein
VWRVISSSKPLKELLFQFELSIQIQIIFGTEVEAIKG